MKLVILGLSITSSWGNGHATTYRALVQEFVKRGHQVTFLERDVPWYSNHRDLPHPTYCTAELYSDLSDLKHRSYAAVNEADFVLVGSYVPEGRAVGEWALQAASGPVGYYDIDTPVTLAKLATNECEYLSSLLIPKYSVFFSFTGGPTLELLEREYGAQRALPLYCSVDPQFYHPLPAVARNSVYDLGYMGTYSTDRQPPLEELMLQPAMTWPEGRFAVAGPQYPSFIVWPPNITRIEHLPPSEHCLYYNQQRYTLNITRADMVKAGYSPSVRLFEAAACGVPIISDHWEGLADFFVPGREILISRSSGDTLTFLRELGDSERKRIAEAARACVLSKHTASHRAEELENAILLCAGEVNSESKSSSYLINMCNNGSADLNLLAAGETTMLSSSEAIQGATAQ